MRTLIGTPASFAIEFEIFDKTDPVQAYWLFGRLCIWADGKAVGSWESGCSLSAAIPAFRVVLDNRGKRKDPSLTALPPAEAFDRLLVALYVDDERSDDEVHRDWDKYSRFLAIPTLDVFDDWHGFLIEDALEGRFIWKQTRDPAATVHEVRLRVGELDRQIQELVQAIENRGK